MFISLGEQKGLDPPLKDETEKLHKPLFTYV